MANLSWNIMLSLIITVSPVAHGFLTNVIDDVISEDTGDVHLFKEKDRIRDVKERALEKLQEVFGLPDLGEKRHHQVPPQFMMELYNNIADQSGFTRRRIPYNATVIRSFIERDNSLCQYFHFNISGLDVTESVLEAQLHLYRMKMPAYKMPPVLFTSPSLIIRVYQVLDEQQLNRPDMHRLLSIHTVGAHSHGWEVFNVTEAVLDWIVGRRPNRGILVTCNTIFEQIVEVRFARRNEHHNSRQPILVLFDDEAKIHGPTTAPITHPRPGNLNYYKYHNDPTNEEGDSSAERAAARQRRSLPNVASANSSSLDSSSADNPPRRANTSGECSRLELFVDFEQIGWSSWIIAPKGYPAYYCKGHCNFPLGQSQRPTNHATVQSIVHELNLAPDVGKPCCVPTSLLNVPLLFYDDNDNVVLRMYEDMVADSCGCL